MREDWVECTLGDVFDFVGGGTPSKSNPNYWNGNIPWASIKDLKGDHLIGTQNFITEEGLKNSSANIANKNEIILATRISPGTPILSKIKTAINQDLKVAKPKIQSEIDYYFWLFNTLKPKILKLSSGTTVLGVNLTNLKSIRFLLPPISIQRAIVAKIEELFSDLDKGIADLKKAQAQLKIYRQAVLKKAFEGELTKEWREKQSNLPTADELLKKIGVNREKWIDEEISKGKSEAKRIRAKLKKLNPTFPSDYLPENWKWTNFISACQFVIDCHNKTAPYEDKGIYLVRTSNIRNGKFDLINKIKFVSQDTYEFWSKRAFPESGDIIFTREAPMGEAGIIPKVTQICLGQRTMLLRINQKWLDNKYLLYNILSEVFQQRFRKDAIGTGVKHLRVGDVESLAFPLCSKEEQNQIVQEIESRLSVCDKVEQNITESLEKAKALRQSILKKAFAGSLLSAAEIAACKAAPDYESASVLLEKIKAEKAGEGKKVSRSKKVKA